MLRVKAPSGRFFIDPNPDMPVVLIAGGIGITPLMSMLRWCVAAQPRRIVHLYYGVRNSREHAFKSLLEELAASHPALHLNVVYSRPGAADIRDHDYQHEGHVDIELLRRTLPHGRHQFYVCGPPAMMQTLVPALTEWGVGTGDIHYEAFGPATVRWAEAIQAPATAADSMPIQFRRSGRTLSWDGRDGSLLDFAERCGIEVESGCRAGSCGSCETRLVEGSVSYAHPPDHDVSAGVLPAVRRSPRICAGPGGLMALKAHLWRLEVLPFLASFAALVLVALALDGLLHVLNLLWIGRWLGIPGTLLILGSTAYSLRKRKLIKTGNPARLLRWHEVLAWSGSLLVLVHAGVHFNAILGWLAVGAMLINVGSGLTGKFLLDRSRRRTGRGAASSARRGAY